MSNLVKTSNQSSNIPSIRNIKKYLSMLGFFAVFLFMFRTPVIASNLQQKEIKTNNMVDVVQFNNKVDKANIKFFNNEKVVRKQDYVYTSNIRAFIGGYAYYGVTEINGQYYLPLEMFTEYAYSTYPAFTWFYSSEGYKFIYDASQHRTIEDQVQLRYKYRTKDGIELGKATAVHDPIIVCSITSDSDEYEYEQQNCVYDAIYLLDNTYPYVNIKALSTLTHVVTLKDKQAMYLFYEEVEHNDKKFEQDLMGIALTKITRDKSDLNSILNAIHDYIVKNIDYNLDESYSIEPIKKNSNLFKDISQTTTNDFHIPYNQTVATSCGDSEQYAKLFQAMCLRVGIPCEIIYGTILEEAHVWNRVYINGKWSYIDVCLDDTNKDSKTIEVSYDYYLLSANELAKTHFWAGDDYPMPEEYDESWENLDNQNIISTDMFRKCLVAGLMQKNKHIVLFTSSQSVYGGITCIQAYDIPIKSITGGYNKTTKAYEYEVSYYR